MAVPIRAVSQAVTYETARPRGRQQGNQRFMGCAPRWCSSPPPVSRCRAHIAAAVSSASSSGDVVPGEPAGPLGQVPEVGGPGVRAVLGGQPPGDQRGLVMSAVMAALRRVGKVADGGSAVLAGLGRRCVVSASLTGTGGAGSVRSVRNVFSGQTFILRIWAKPVWEERTDRLGNYVEHGWGLAVSWDDSGARTGPHEMGLIAKIAARNDDDAARRIYRKYRMELFRFGVHVLHDQELAEEMVQETCIKFWQRAGSYDAKRGSVRAWLFTMAKSAAIDIARRPSSRPLLPVEDFQLPPQYDSVDEALTILTVDQALDKLPSIYSDVMRLIRDGFTHSEIAGRLDIPIGTVKSRTAKAADTLRAELASMRGGDDAF
jgi:RNA polymerase sigma-70 factor, ECF subfamily